MSTHERPTATTCACCGHSIKTVEDHGAWCSWMMAELAAGRSAIPQSEAPLTAEEVRYIECRARRNPIKVLRVEGEPKRLIAEHLAGEAEAWLRGDQPLLVTMLGRHSIRVSTELTEAEGTAGEIAAALVRDLDRFLATISAQTQRADNAENLIAVLNEQIAEIRGVVGAASDEETTIAVRRVLAERDTEIARMQRIFEKKAKPTFEPFTRDGDGVGLAVHDEMGIGSLIIGELAGMLTTTGAVNYVQISGWRHGVGRFEATVQRVGKMSPHEARTEAERHLGRAVTMLRANGIAWDGPTEFPPDEAPTHTVPVDDATPWLTIDCNVQPNDMVCARCGIRAPMPVRGSADVINAMLRAFGEEHIDCREGDAAP